MEWPIPNDKFPEEHTGEHSAYESDLSADTLQA